MAHRCGNSCPYGYGHHEEHARAARLGWRRRRDGEARYLGDAFGGDFELHTHDNKRYIMQHKESGEYLEMNRREAREIINDKRREDRSREQERRHQEREDRQRRERERAQQLTLSAQTTRRAEAEARRYKVHREREERYQKRESAEYERRMLYDAVREVAPRGIANYAKDRNGKRPVQEDVWQNIPNQFHARRTARDAQTADEVAAHLSENYPYLNVHSDSDLAQAFQRAQFRAREARKAA